MSKWNNPASKITPHFTIGEALYLPKWDAYHRPTEVQKNAIMKTALVMEAIRSFLGDRPISVTSWMRPEVACIAGHPKDGCDYNSFIKGAKRSAHRYGLACDFVVDDIDSDTVRARLLPMLEVWGIRLEDLGGASWVHIDLMDPRPNRFFRP